MGGVYYFPTNFVYWQQVKNHDKIKDILLTQIEKIKHLSVTGNIGLHAASTDYEHKFNKNKLLTDKNMIKDIVWDPLDDAIHLLNSRDNTNKIVFNESTISESWYTEYNEGGNFTLHNHVGTSIDTFSMIYILKDENKNNTTVFREMTNDWISTSSNCISETSFDTSMVKDIKEGSVLIFPSTLYHYVSSVKIPGRITIAINLTSR
jgi:hypothetical protein